MFKNNEFHQSSQLINSEISKRYNSILMILLLCQYCWSLLCCNYGRSLILGNLASWNRLKLTVQIQLALHPCDSSSVNNVNMTVHSVEKDCFIAWNVKLQVKIKFKRFSGFQNYFKLLSPWTLLLAPLVLLEILYILALGA